MRLLLVEDDRMLGAGLQAGLRQKGWAVDWVRDGNLADEALRGEPYDVVLLDLGLPGKSGLEVLRALRGRGGTAPVLILTAQDAVSDRVTGFAFDPGGTDVWTIKPPGFRASPAPPGSIFTYLSPMSPEVLTVA